MAQDIAAPLPRTLALVDDDAEYSEFLLQHLAALGIEARHFADSNDLLTSDGAFEHGFYLVDLMLPGVDGVELIRLLRRRTPVGIVVVSGRLAPEVFSTVVDAGADMHLAKPVSFDQVVVAIRAVHRRVAAPLTAAWRLDPRASRLLAPDGTSIDLSESDLAVMSCFLDAQGGTVDRDTLCRRLGRPLGADSDNALSATIYRLRRRIERATPLPVPLHTQARVGYVFKGGLQEA
jgi:two-component system, OmpR family, response regulator